MFKGAFQSGCLLGFFLLGTVFAAAEEVVISEDGRQIQLNGDGTWVQLSADRYAVNAAGERIRIKADGTWSVLAEKPIVENFASTPLTPLSSAHESTLYLSKVEILKRRIKRAKSIHAQTVTIYHLQITNERPEPIQLGGDLERMLVARSSAGETFEVQSVQLDTRTLEPGQRTTLTVEAEGSPRWFGVKAMSLEVAPNALGNSQARLLTKSMSDVVRRNVDEL